MKYVLMVLVIGLLIAHQDYWNWNDPTLVFGFLPMGLFYHLVISVAASLVWWFGVTWVWPKSFTELDSAIATNTLKEREGLDE